MTGSGSITRRPAPARRSCSCTSLPATTAAGSRNCASLRGAIAALPSTRAAGRPPTCRPTSPATRRPAPSTISPACSMQLDDRQGTRRRPVDGRPGDAALRPHLSPTRALAARGGGGLRVGTRRTRKVPQRGGSHRRQARGGGHGGVRCSLRLWSHARAIRGQGPARVRRVQGDAGRALGQGRRQHAARRATRAAVDLRAARTSSRRSPCRCSSSRATRTGPACCRAFSSRRPAP